METDRLREHKIKVVFDTSALLTPFEFSINIDFELEKLLGSFDAFVPSCVIEELNTLAEKSSGRRKRNASAALKLVEKYEIIDCKYKDPDEALLEIAKRLSRAVIITNDMDLIKKLKSENLPVIHLRGKNRFILEGELNQFD